MSGSFSIPGSLLDPPLLTTTKVLGADVILRRAPADVDCRRRFTAGRALITFWPLFRSFGESKYGEKRRLERFRSLHENKTHRLWDCSCMICKVSRSQSTRSLVAKPGVSRAEEGSYLPADCCLSCRWLALLLCNLFEGDQRQRKLVVAAG